VNLLQATADANLFGPWFRDRATWSAWFAFIAALFGLPMTDDQGSIYRECTGRDKAPEQPAEEAWLICGRRAGKSYILALIAVFLACFRNYEECLAPGERATILIVASDRKQARTIFRYLRAMLTRISMLAPMIERETADTFELDNSVSIEVGTASFRAVRGYSIAAALCDELAFWPQDDSVTPDYEILDALRPAMSTIPGSMLLCASSPYARRGALWDAFKRWFGKDVPQLVWRAPTTRMNPTVPQSVIDRAMERDASSAAAEYLAEFRSDVESYVSREAVEAVITPGVIERPSIAGTRYAAFVDPSGGSSDSMTLAIAHAEKETAVLDAIRERRPPFSPEGVVEEFVALLRQYRVCSVRGDRYGGEWPREQFRKLGVSYELSDRPKSDLYRDCLPVINSGRVDLLDLPRLTAQLCSLERRTSRGGRDSIDHAPGSHDDVANVAAGAVVEVIGKSKRVATSTEILL
jgi:hypothetical protein